MQGTRIIKLTLSNQPIRVISESFKDALGEVNSEDNFAKHALLDYDDEDIAVLTDEQISNLVDEASKTFDGVMAEYEAPSYFDADPDMRSNFDNDEFSMASGKKRAEKKADKKAAKHEAKLAKKAARVETIKAKREVAQARIESKNAKKALRQANRAARKGDKAAARQAKKLAKTVAKATRKLTKANAKATKKAIKAGKSEEELPTDEMQDGAVTNEAGTADNGNLQDTSSSQDTQGGEDSSMGEQKGQGGAYPETDENSAPESDDGGQESQQGIDETDVEEAEQEESQEPVATEDEGEETDGFNGLDADPIGSNLFENEMMSELRGGKSKRRNRISRPQRRARGNNRHGEKRHHGQKMGGYSKNGHFQPANKDQSQTDMQMEAAAMSSFDGDEQSYFSGKKTISTINWKMVALGTGLAVAAIWAVKKYKLIK